MGKKNSKGADEAQGPFFHNNQYPVHLPISFPSIDILTVLPIQRHRRPIMLTLS